MKKILAVLCICMNCISYANIYLNKISNDLGYPIYFFKTDGYDKNKDFESFFKECKKIKVEKGYSEVSFVIEGEIGNLDRIDIRGNNYILVDREKGFITSYTEEEFLNKRIIGKNNQRNDIKLNYNIKEEKIAGLRKLTLRIKLNREASQDEMEKIAKEIYKSELKYKKSYRIESTKTNVRYEEFILFFYLSNQDIYSQSFGKVILDKKGKII
ncbi:hypothetical protein [Fusobacterium perfoetens]|uniref:hypothetical protein n=1 Tax=Fusobacterium perfoetens TaxID=852 RepID=UPI001F279E69|nr:hypothetical protein [Fusobacterium perfoetens]MCF2611613.1 hypothetical protein [Fusobacterium perfoetens]